jgi:hypothetical protein
MDAQPTYPTQRSGIKFRLPFALPAGGRARRLGAAALGTTATLGAVLLIAHPWSGGDSNRNATSGRLGDASSVAPTITVGATGAGSLPTVPSSSSTGTTGGSTTSGGWQVPSGGSSTGGDTGTGTYTGSGPYAGPASTGGPITVPTGNSGSSGSSSGSADGGQVYFDASSGEYFVVGSDGVPVPVDQPPAGTSVLPSSDASGVVDPSYVGGDGSVSVQPSGDTSGGSTPSGDTSGGNYSSGSSDVPAPDPTPAPAPDPTPAPEPAPAPVDTGSGG